MTREPWYESTDPVRITRAIGVRILLAFLAVGVLGVIGWGIKVAVSDIKGQGDAVRAKNSATNRIAAQERFEGLYAELVAADQRIDVLAAAVAANPKSVIAQSNLTGIQTYCLSVVADYNAEARKYTARDFRAIDLPAQIDLLDPATDCKESSR